LLCLLIITGMDSFFKHGASNIEFDFALHGGVPLITLVL
jgi:hypothetical protein